MKRSQMAARKRKFKANRTPARRHLTATQHSPHFPRDADVSDGPSETESDSTRITQVSTTTTTIIHSVHQAVLFSANVSVPVHAM